MLKRFFSLAAIALLTTAIPAFAQDDDIDAAVKKATEKAMEDANKPASKEKMKKLEDEARAETDQADAENKAEEAKQKAAAQAVVDAKGPASFPAWTPQVPQFTPAGPPVRKLVDGEPMLIQIGTSPLSPEALCDAWDQFKNPQFSHERSGSEVNHSFDLHVAYRKNDDNTTVKMEVVRAAGEKITKVTISSPLPVPVEPTN